MKTILLVLNGPNIANTIAFGCYLSGITRARLVGVFLCDKISETTSALKEMYGHSYVENILSEDLPERTHERMEQQIGLFKETCRKKGINSTMYSNQRVTLKEVLAESRFVDLIVTDSVFSNDKSREGLPDNMLKILLAGAECPVLVTPFKPTPIEEIVFCYDGSEEAFFAMKQLVYLLPELDEVKATVLEVNSGQVIEENEQLQVSDWLSRHYSYTEFVIVNGKPEVELFSYLAPKKNTLVVMGAYGRSILSRFFQESKADKLIKQLAFPLFITHH